MDRQLWFTSTLFEIEPGEDEETNPLCYGRQLAGWVQKEFLKLGYPAQEVIPEDWGWCVMCSRDPFMLWVGCVGVHSYVDSHPGDVAPTGKDITWTCFVVSEQPFFERLFRRMDTSVATDRLFQQLGAVLDSEPGITLTEPPE